MEILDLYDENRKLLNKKHIRGNKFKVGEYFVVVSIWTFTLKNELLITYRHPKKEYANTWENTAGAIISGESSFQGAIRELFEETGLNVKQEELTKIDCIKETNAFVDNYFTKINFGLKDIRLQAGETVDSRLVTLKEFEDMISAKVVAEPVAKRYFQIKDKLLKFL